MAIKLDHTVIYAKKHAEAANEFADIMGLRVGKIAGVGYEFSTVRVNNDLSIYFMDRDNIGLEQHSAFAVDARTFGKIHKRLEKNDLAFGSSPFERENQRTDHDFAARGLFWTNVDGCLFEIMTYEF